MNTKIHQRPSLSDDEMRRRSLNTYFHLLLCLNPLYSLNQIKFKIAIPNLDGILQISLTILLQIVLKKNVVLHFVFLLVGRKKWIVLISISFFYMRCHISNYNILMCSNSWQEKCVTITYLFNGFTKIVTHTRVFIAS